MLRFRPVIVFLVVLALPLSADILILKDGTIHSGDVSTSENAYEVRTSAGVKTFPLGVVERVVMSPEALTKVVSEYRNRARSRLENAGDPPAPAEAARAALRILELAQDLCREGRKVYPGNAHADLDRLAEAVRKEAQRIRDLIPADPVPAKAPETSVPATPAGEVQAPPVSDDAPESEDLDTLAEPLKNLPGGEEPTPEPDAPPAGEAAAEKPPAGPVPSEAPAADSVGTKPAPVPTDPVPAKVSDAPPAGESATKKSPSDPVPSGAPTAEVVETKETPAPTDPVPAKAPDATVSEAPAGDVQAPPVSDDAPDPEDLGTLAEPLKNLPGGEEPTPEPDAPPAGEAAAEKPPAGPVPSEASAADSVGTKPTPVPTDPEPAKLSDASVPATPAPEDQAPPVSDDAPESEDLDTLAGPLKNLPGGEEPTPEPEAPPAGEAAAEKLPADPAPSGAPTAEVVETKETPVPTDPVPVKTPVDSALKEPDLGKKPGSGAVPVPAPAPVPPDAALRPELSLRSEDWALRTNGRAKLRSQAGALRLELEPVQAGEKVWAYAHQQFFVHRKLSRFEGVRIRMRIRQAAPNQVLRVVFHEADAKNSLWCSLPGRPAAPVKDEEWVTRFVDLKVPPWVDPDADGRLDPEQVDWIQIGCDNVDGPTVIEFLSVAFFPKPE